VNLLHGGVKDGVVHVSVQSRCHCHTERHVVYSWQRSNHHQTVWRFVPSYYPAVPRYARPVYYAILSACPCQHGRIYHRTLFTSWHPRNSRCSHTKRRGEIRTASLSPVELNTTCVFIVIIIIIMFTRFIWIFHYFISETIQNTYIANCSCYQL